MQKINLADQIPDTDVPIISDAKVEIEVRAVTPPVESSNHTTEPPEEDLYRLWDEFYKTQFTCGTNVMSHSVYMIQCAGRDNMVLNKSLILVDSGASRSVCGRSWINQWYKGES